MHDGLSTLLASFCIIFLEEYFGLAGVSIDRDGLNPIQQGKGCNISSWYEIFGERWFGKVNINISPLSNALGSRGRRVTKRELNFAAVMEKIAFDCFSFLSFGTYLVPDSFLHEQPIMDEMNSRHPLAREFVSNNVYSCLRVFSKSLPGFRDFSEVKVEYLQRRMNLIDFIETTHSIPRTVLDESNQPVQLIGLIELLVVARLLADIDSIGGSGTNAGIVYERNAKGEKIARVVKIDPGLSFSFIPNVNSCMNILFQMKSEGATEKCGFYSTSTQIATQYRSLDIHWDYLSDPQKITYFKHMKKCYQHCANVDVMSFLFFRQGQFGFSEDHVAFVELMITYWTEWLSYQTKCFAYEWPKLVNSIDFEVLQTYQLDSPVLEIKSDGPSKFDQENELDTVKCLNKADLLIDDWNQDLEDLKHSRVQRDYNPQALYPNQSCRKDSKLRAKSTVEKIRTAVMLSAALGDPEAQHLLGVMYENGTYFSQNIEFALTNYQLAADQGHPGAKQDLDRLSNERNKVN